MKACKEMKSLSLQKGIKQSWVQIKNRGGVREHFAITAPECGRCRKITVTDNGDFLSQV